MGVILQLCQILHGYYKKETVIMMKILLCAGRTKEKGKNRWVVPATSEGVWYHSQKGCGFKKITNIVIGTPHEGAEETSLSPLRHSEACACTRRA